MFDFASQCLSKFFTSSEVSDGEGDTTGAVLVIVEIGERLSTKSLIGPKSNENIALATRGASENSLE